MDEIEELKKSLGAAAKDYNDTQIRLLSRELDLMAEFLLDLYIYRIPKRRSVNSPAFDIFAAECVACREGPPKKTN